ncbi:hypothetical protein BU26DRAFT_611772 [Trematosphaeria pertusa]|uniref:PD-(D/E)XK nuclease-like domain-containing protein n=1 Tax=Trematosphaeria pertusa TaxID=390896 RepID=A0A6A6HQ82_9PLEO|nr:uncharacterized protein BU26DRAFT_611772 [Trematosphaeria pertusa]KAF2240286.1 hypothetical protein BU26DRAFT_611772 [Trematosphaeria pertusa]
MEMNVGLRDLPNTDEGQSSSPLTPKLDGALTERPTSPSRTRTKRLTLPLSTPAYRLGTPSHVSDAFTKTTALFSGIEAKPADGDKSEVEYQISIWMGASLRKKAELARMAGLSDITSALIEPAFVVVGHEWYFYLVYLQPTGAVHVLEHGSCSTNSVSGVFKILRVLRNVIEYGLEGFERGTGSEGWILGWLLGTGARECKCCDPWRRGHMDRKYRGVACYYLTIGAEPGLTTCMNRGEQYILY